MRVSAAEVRAVIARVPEAEVLSVIRKAEALLRSDDPLDRLRIGLASVRVELVRLSSLIEQQQRPAPAESPYLDVAQAAAYCRVAVKTIYNHRKLIERVPGIRKLVFTRPALDAWLTSRRRKR